MKAFDINKIQLNIQSPHLEIKMPLNRYILSKIEKLGKMYGRIERCGVLIKRQKSDNQKNYSVSIELLVPGHTLYTSERKENPRLAVKAAFDDLLEQLARFKEKITDNTKSTKIQMP